MCSADIFLGLLAVLFPPLPVWVKRGICGADSLINILLCCLGFIPGLLHSWYIIAKFPDPEYDYDELPNRDQEGGRVQYVYVHAQPPQQQQPSASIGHMNYGTQGRQEQGVTHAGEGSSGGQANAPPSYAEVTAGDHKIQSRD